MKKIYVVDQNAMRERGPWDWILGVKDVRFVIPDTALVEMVKGANWEGTFQNSFRALAPVATRCFAGMPIKESLDFEISKGRSVDGELFPRELTNSLRATMVSSQLSNGSMNSRLRLHMHSLQEELRERDLNAAGYRDELMAVAATLRDGLSKNELTACRREGDLGRQNRREIAKAIGEAMFDAQLAKRGVSSQVAGRLWRGRSMHRRWCYLMVHHALQWLGEGGLESASSARLLNDMLDQDYVLLGSFVDGVISLESDVRTASEDLRLMLELPLERSYESLA